MPRPGPTSDSDLSLWTQFPVPKIGRGRVAPCKAENESPHGGGTDPLKKQVAPANQMPLYHKQAYGLPDIKLSRCEGLTLSKHALEAVTRRRITIDLTVFDPTTCRVFELEIRDFLPFKVAARKRYNYFLDVCFVIEIPSKLVRTCWLNESCDPHLTLDKSLYSKPNSAK